jgi:hypothetical protein
MTMRQVPRRFWLGLLVAALALAMTTSLWPTSSPPSEAQDVFDPEPDPDVPRFAKRQVDKADYLFMREESMALKRGWEPGKPFDTAARNRALAQFEQQAFRLKAQGGAPAGIASTTTWTPIGPAPIPNGSVTGGGAVPVSGRVTAIAVDPTDPNTAYVGTAQGGLWRTTNGGTNWTPLMDAAQSLAIGAVTIDATNPTTVWVGTGEGNESLDSFFGVGLYRIRNASTSPIVEGPFETRVAGTGTAIGNGHAFVGTAINRIAIDPNNNSRMFVGNVFGGSGVSGDGICCGGVSPPSGEIGLYFTDTAQGTTPVFSKVAIPGFNGLQDATDVVFEPGSSNNLLVAVEDFSGFGLTGVYRATDAASASVSGNVAPTLARTFNPGGPVNMKLAINTVGPTVTVLAATGESIGGGNGGVLRKSVDGGQTFSSILTAANGFCGGQCFYDIALAIHPSDAQTIYLGGASDTAPAHIFTKSTDGGTTFTPSSINLHPDVHAITLAPNNPAVIYHGNDGGVWRSVNSGAT